MELHRIASTIPHSTADGSIIHVLLVHGPWTTPQTCQSMVVVRMQAPVDLNQSCSRACGRAAVACVMHSCRRHGRRQHVHLVRSPSLRDHQNSLLVMAWHVR